MRFTCMMDCYDNSACIGYRFGLVYDFTEADITHLKEVGLFPKKFEALDYEAKAFLKPKKEEPKPEVKEEPKPATKAASK